MNRAVHSFCMAACLGVGVSFGQVLAVPLSLTINQSLSSLGGAQITGSILADLDSGAQSLTFSGGSSIAVATNATVSGVIPQSAFSAGPVTTVTASGSYQASMSDLTLDLISGAIVNGSASSIPIWSGSGSGSLVGSLDLQINVLGSLSSTTINFSTGVTLQQPAFTSSAGLPIALSITPAGATLSLPFDVPFVVSSATFSGGGLASEVISAIGDFLNGTLASAVTVGDGLVVASDVANAPEPAVLSLLVLGLAGLGWSRRKNKMWGGHALFSVRRP